jgi:hypothetical protein
LKWPSIGAAATNVVDSCAIITGEPNELTAPVHDRMPVIPASADYPLWLDPEFEETGCYTAGMSAEPTLIITEYHYSIDWRGVLYVAIGLAVAACLLAILFSGRPRNGD